MTLRALLGLAALDGLLLAVGYAVLFAILGRVNVRLALRLGGVAFWVGTAVVGLALVLLAVATGIGPRPAVVVAAALVVATVSLVVGLRRRAPALEEARDRFGLFSVPFAAAAGVMLAALFAEAYARPLYAWDAWAMWIPKAKALYFSGGFGPDTFPSELAGPTYPLLVPVLHGGAFGFMGSANEVAIHLQAWVFLAAFAWAVAGLLRPVVPHALIWPFLAFMLVLPEVNKRVLQPDADYPSFFLFVLGALAFLRWTASPRREAWLPLVGTILLAACASTRREGLAYVLAVAIAGLVASGRELRSRGPILVGAAAAAIVTSLPWALWLRVHHVTVDRPALVGTITEAATAEGNRIARGVGAVLEYVFRYEFWSVAPWIGVILLAASVALGPRRLGVFAATALSVVFAAMLWRVLWYQGETVPQLTSIPRLAATVSLFLLATAPLLAHGLVAAAGQRRSRVAWRGLAVLRRVPASVLIALAVLPAAAYLAVGVSRGSYAFLGEQCAPEVSEHTDVVAVFGRPDSYDAAVELRDAVVGVGFVGTRIGIDQCAQLRVQLSGLNGLEHGREIQRQARTANLVATLEGG